jgi:8-oxo-dGTP diphosphatase
MNGAFMHCYDYPRPALTVDCVVFGLAATGLQVLLIERGLPPFAGCWALPGGFVRLEESLEKAARRELAEETGLGSVFLEQLCTIGSLDRDPRERVVTVAYYALVNAGAEVLDARSNAESDARQARWFGVADLPTLAFDHGAIVGLALDRLRGKLRYAPIGFELLPRKFTLTQLQQLYETVLNRQFDKRNFRKKLLKMDLLIPLEEHQQGVQHRAAQLYSFDEARYQELQGKGFSFEL